MKTEDPVVVRTYTTRQTAEMAVLELASCGIEASLATDDAGGAYPFLDLTNGIAVLVHKAQEKEAKTILEEMNSRDNVHLPTDEHEAKPKKAKYILLGILIGAIVASAGWWMHMHRYGNGIQKIYDKKGKVREVYHFKNGSVDWIKRDRNGDGQFDVWSTVNSGQCDQSKADDNFDGKPDLWATYSDNFNCIIERDMDFDGIPDEKIIQKNEIVTLIEVTPKQTNIVYRREIYQDGNIKEEYCDEDMDGTFDVKKVFDPMGKEISVTRLTK